MADSERRGDADAGGTEPAQADPAQAHVRLLESLERVDGAIRVADDLDDMMVAVLDTVLDVFACDRAWLLFPCDPTAPSWNVPMERTRAGYPGALAVGAVIPMLPEAREVFRLALADCQPLGFGPGSGRPLPEHAAQMFGIRSQLVLAIQRRVGRPWLFGVHQCSHVRVWSPSEQRLFQEIGRRIGDALTSLLVLRDLRASEEKYREVVEGTDDAVVRLDDALCLTYVNQAGGRIIGQPPDACLGRSLLDVLHPDDQDGTKKAIEAAASERAASVAVENRLVGAPGDVHHMLWTVNLHFAEGADRPTDYTAIGHDITQRVQAEDDLRSLEKRLFLAQKMEAVGTLAGGIAHDFNNILGAIMGYADLARTSLDERTEAHEFLVQLLKAARRARDLVQQILTFSRRAEHQTAPVDIRRVTHEALKLLRASIPRTIDIHEDLPREPAVVFGDETRLHQVLMNLCTNAYHAMRVTGGRLDVGLSFGTLDAEAAKRPADAAPASYVVLTVRDTGIGMDAATLARAFEPFFTTKGRGGGSGMGLSVVHGIVEAHGGVVQIESAPGGGTTVTVLLPRHDAPAEERKPPLPAPRGGDERVLFVDDEAALAEVGREMLAQLGYRAIATTDSQGALALFRSAPDAFDVVVSDQTMPRLTGVELASAVHGLRPDLPIILCTGYSDTLSGVSAKEIGVSEILMKPLDRDTLARAVRDALDR